jgi:hypothetical protein
VCPGGCAVSLLGVSSSELLAHTRYCLCHFVTFALLFVLLKAEEELDDKMDS